MIPEVSPSIGDVDPREPCSRERLLRVFDPMLSLIEPRIQFDERGPFFVAHSDELWEWAFDPQHVGIEAYRARHQVARIICKIVDDDRAGARDLVFCPGDDTDDDRELALDQIRQGLTNLIRFGTGGFYAALGKA